MKTEELHRKETGQGREGKNREARVKLDRLVEQGEWMRLKYNEEFQEMSLPGKISTAMKAVNVRIGQMEKIFYSELPQRPRNSAIILEKTIKPMRRLNDALGARLGGEFEQQDEKTNEVVELILGTSKEKRRSVVSVDSTTISKNQISTLKKAA